MLEDDVDITWADILPNWKAWAFSIFKFYATIVFAFLAVFLFTVGALTSIVASVVLVVHNIVVTIECFIAGIMWLIYGNPRKLPVSEAQSQETMREYCKYWEVSANSPYTSDDEDDDTTTGRCCSSDSPGSYNSNDSDFSQDTNTTPESDTPPLRPALRCSTSDHPPLRTGDGRRVTFADEVEYMGELRKERIGAGSTSANGNHISSSRSRQRHNRNHHGKKKIRPLFKEYEIIELLPRRPAINQEPEIPAVTMRAPTRARVEREEKKRQAAAEREIAMLREHGRVWDFGY